MKSIKQKKLLIPISIVIVILVLVLIIHLLTKPLTSGITISGNNNVREGVQYSYNISIVPNSNYKNVGILILAPQTYASQSYSSVNIDANKKWDKTIKLTFYVFGPNHKLSPGDNGITVDVFSRVKGLSYTKLINRQFYPIKVTPTNNLKIYNPFKVQPSNSND